MGLGASRCSTSHLNIKDKKDLEKLFCGEYGYRVATQPTYLTKIGGGQEVGRIYGLCNRVGLSHHGALYSMVGYRVPVEYYHGID